MGHCSHIKVVVVSTKKVKIISFFFFFFYSSYLGKSDIVLGKKGGYFQLGMVPNSAPREGQKIP